MRPDSTEAAWAAACAAEPDQLTRDEIASVLGDVRRARSHLDSIEMRCSRRLRELEAHGQAEAPAGLLASAGGRTGRDAHSVTERDDLCNEVPDVEDALDDGSISAGHLDAITAATRHLPEPVRAEFLAMSDTLLARATQVTLDAFARECRQLAKQLLARSTKGSDADELDRQRNASRVTRWVDTSTGMHHTRLELDPIRDAKLSAAINTELAHLRTVDGSAKTPWQQMLVDATLNAITGDHTEPHDDTSGAGRSTVRADRVPEITVLIDHTSLIGGAGHAGICETENGIPLPVSAVRRMCCDAEVLPVVLGGAGEVLDVGRSIRTANRAQRRALRAMHHGCAHPDCTVGFDACRIHHVRWWWEHRGPTDIDNLLPLCERHHHLVHEGGWNLTMTPNRVATWRRPDGTTHHTGTTIDRTPRHTPRARKPTNEHRSDRPRQATLI